MRKRWTAAGMLVAEQQLRRIIGYRELAKLVIAVERHATLAAPRTSTAPRSPSPLPSDRQLSGSPSKFHDDPDILYGWRRRYRAQCSGPCREPQGSSRRSRASPHSARLLTIAPTIAPSASSAGVGRQAARGCPVQRARRGPLGRAGRRWRLPRRASARSQAPRERADGARSASRSRYRALFRGLASCRR